MASVFPKSIFVSAGHSNSDPGAVGRHLGADGKAVHRREADIAVEFRNLVSFYLTQASIPHELDGSGTQNLPLRDAVLKAKRHPIGVEFHCNAAANSSATGVETLGAPKDERMAVAICKAISEALGLRNRGAKPESAGQHHRLAFVQAGGVIVELFFITNSGDLAAYDAKKWVAAKAVAAVLIAEARK